MQHLSGAAGPGTQGCFVTLCFTHNSNSYLFKLAVAVGISQARHIKAVLQADGQRQSLSALEEQAAQLVLVSCQVQQHSAPHRQLAGQVAIDILQHQRHSLGVKVIDVNAALTACTMAGKHLVALWEGSKQNRKLSKEWKIRLE